MFYLMTLNFIRYFFEMNKSRNHANEQILS